LITRFGTEEQAVNRLDKRVMVVIIIIIIVIVEGYRTADCKCAKGKKNWGL
jgi:hypothetical protein